MSSLILPKNLKINVVGYNNSIQNVYQAATSFLSTPINLDYTDHTVKHSERMLEIIDDILPAADFLNDCEKYVLVCAVLLHDIGMQKANVFDNVDVSLLTKDQYDKIRDMHNEYSEQIIIDSVSEEKAGAIKLGLVDDVSLVERIALVAKAHRKVNLDEIKENIKVGGCNIRLRFLSAIIRLADCLDIDYRRVDMKKLKLISLNSESKFHWHKHKYVESLNFENETFTVSFLFPESFRVKPDFSDVFTAAVKSDISRHLDQVRSIFKKEKIYLEREIEININYSELQILPDDVAEYINNMPEHTNVDSAEDNVDVYICHDNTSTGNLVAKVCDKLNSYGIKTFCSKETEDIASYNAIRVCKLFVLLINKAVNHSAIVNAEISHYKRCADKDNRMAFLPFQLEPYECNLNGALKEIIENNYVIKASVIGQERAIEDILPEIIHARLNDVLSGSDINTNFLRSTNKTCELRSSFVSDFSILSGRDDEINKIYDNLKLQPYKVFVYGMDGIGKSEVVKGYITRYRDLYDKIIWVSYENNIRETINNDYSISVSGLTRNDYISDEDYFKAKLKILNLNTDNRTLFVIDNFNGQWSEELDKFCDGNYSVIFITQEHQRISKFNWVEISGIKSIDILLEIFKKNYQKPMKGNDVEIVKNIILKLQSNTLCITLAASIMQHRNISPAEMEKYLENEKIYYAKFGDQKDIHGLLESLIRCIPFSQGELYVVKNLSLMPSHGVNVEKFKEWIERKEFNIFEIIDNLIYKGYVIYGDTDDKISLHPLIADVFNKGLENDHDCCNTLIENFDRIADSVHIKNYSEKRILSEVINCVADKLPKTHPKYWNVRKCQAIICFDFSQYGKSLDIFKELINSPKDLKDKLYLYNKISHGEVLSGRWDNSIKIASEGLKLLKGKNAEQLEGEQDTLEIYIELLSRLTEANRDAGHLFEAEKYGRMVVEVSKKYYHPLGKFKKNTSDGWTMYHLSRVLYLLDKADESKKLIKEAMYLFEVIDNTWSIAFCYDLYGQLLMKEGHLSEALNYSQKAYDILVGKLGQNHVDIAVNYEWKGNIYAKNGDKIKAIYFYQKAKEILEGQNLPIKVKYAEELVRKIESDESDIDNVSENEKPAIRSVLPNAKEFFIGRDADLEKIHKMFCENANVVYLEGISGIGKTEIAKQYAIKYRAKYHTVLYLMYSEGIKELICDDNQVKIDNFNRIPAESTEQYFMRKLNCLQSITNENDLIIIDGFDMDDDPNLHRLFNGKYKILITTRKHLSDTRSIKVGEITDPEKAIQIFENNLKNDLSDNEKGKIKDLLEMIDYHTYCIELLAKQMDACYYDGFQLYSFYRDDFQKTKLTANDRNKTTVDIIRLIFEKSGKDLQKQRIMMLMSIVGKGGIQAQRFKEWAELKDFSDVILLENESWIRVEPGQKIALHPLVAEAMHQINSPDTKNCSDFLRKVSEFAYKAWFTENKDKLLVADNILSILKFFSPFKDSSILMFDSMCNFLWQVARFDEAIKYSRILYDTCLESYGEASMITGCVAKTIGGCYFNNNQISDSVGWYAQGLRSMLLSGQGIHNELALAYDKMARCLVWLGDTDKALSYFNASLVIRYEILERIRSGEKIPLMYYSDRYYTEEMIRDGVSETYMEMGRMYQSLGDYQTALKFSDKQISICTYKDDKSGTSYAYVLYDRGVCYYKLGLQMLAKGKTGDSKKLFAIAAENLEGALEINDRMRGRYSTEVLDNLEYLADVYLKQGKNELAAEKYEAALSAIRNWQGFSEKERVQRLEDKLKSLATPSLITI